ncbi:hypothetical protein PG984_000453 [Apiospora sp. TS-2023a]
MGSYLGPDGYFHSASIPFPNTTVDFTFPATADTDNSNYYYPSRHNSNNDNLPSFPDTFGPTTTATTTSNISHPDFTLQIPYGGYCPGFDPQYQFRQYAETQTLGHPAQFQQPSLPSLPHLPLPSPNFGGGNTHPFCGGFDQSESPSGLISSNQSQIPSPHSVPNQGYYHHSHPLSSSSAFFPAQEFGNPSTTSPVQDQSQVVQQCAGAPHRPQDSVDPPSNSPSRSFDNNIDIGNSSNDIYHLHQRSHNHQPPTISGTFLPPTQQQPPLPPPLSLITQNTNFDSISSANIPSAVNTASGQEPGSDDYYVSALTSTNFSSPSLPPLNSSPFTAARTQTTQLTDPSSFPQPDFGSEMPGAAASSTGLGPRRSRRLSQVVDLTKEENRHDINLLSSSPAPMGPPPTASTRKRRRSSATNASASNRRTSVSNSQRPVRRSRGSARHASPDGSVFGESSPAPQAKEEDLEVLDLSKADEVPKELQKPAIDNRVKLSKFQCVICMDDVSNLTVTHCGMYSLLCSLDKELFPSRASSFQSANMVFLGHLFCSECLHSALHIDSNKKCCPVCRSKVDIRSTGKNLKSYYHLELKVMTATRKGKQPVGR